MAQNIGVFKFRNIGDVLMITPALRALRQAFPKARITVWVNSVTHHMLDRNPHVDEVFVYDRSIRQREGLTALINHEAWLCKKVREQRMDLAIDYTSSSRPGWYSLVSGAAERVAFSAPLWRRPTQRHFYTKLIESPPPNCHEVERHLFLLRKLGIPVSDDRLCLQTCPEAQHWASSLIAPYRDRKIIHIHPVSRWLFKCWDDVKMAALIDWMEMEKGVKVFVTGDSRKAEVERIQSIISHCRSTPVVLAGSTSLGQLAALSEQSDCFVGVDTAPMHMAAAVGTPVVALFGPSGPEVWHPWCEKQITLSSPCYCNLSAEKRCDWLQVRGCLNSISLLSVQAAVERLYDGTI